MLVAGWLTLNSLSDVKGKLVIPAVNHNMLVTTTLVSFTVSLVLVH